MWEKKDVSIKGVALPVKAPPYYLRKDASRKLIKYTCSLKLRNDSLELITQLDLMHKSLTQEATLSVRSKVYKCSATSSKAPLHDLQTL